MSKILPIYENCQLRQAPNIDIPLMIIFSELKNYKYAFLENFIDVVIFNRPGGGVNLYQITPLECFNYCALRYEMLPFINDNYIKLIKNAIDNEYYVSVMCDTSFIDAYQHSKELDMAHQLLNFGYDADLELF